MFRMATEKDCDAVYRLICDMEAKTLSYDDFTRIYRRQAEDARNECMICEEAQEIVGVLNLRYEEQLHHAAMITEIMEFVVDSRYRSKGYGSRMLDYACRRAGEKGCIQIEVACNQLRKDTHRFYLREGMKNYHFKFSKGLTGHEPDGNVLGR